MERLIVVLIKRGEAFVKIKALISTKGTVGNFALILLGTLLGTICSGFVWTMEIMFNTQSTLVNSC